MFHPMTDHDTDSLSDLDIMARTVWGESRDQPFLGKLAVACVIMNRVKHGGWWGNTVRSVCLKPFQFSCWLKNDPNRAKMLTVQPDDPSYICCVEISKTAMNGSAYDVSDGADSYYAKSMKVPPKWAHNLTPCANIKDHIFFRTV